MTTAAGPSSSTEPSADDRIGLFAPAHRRESAAIIAVVVLIAFEAMGVATVMPLAVTALSGLSLYAWAFSGYLIMSLFGMVVSGESCDRRGPGPAFVTGIALFAGGLVVSGLAGSMIVFILGRGIQGYGGGLVIVAVYVIVGRRLPESVRPAMFSAMAAAWVLPSIIGPSLAGWVGETWSWRWVFLAVPMLIAPVLVLFLPSLRDLEPAPDPRPRARQKRLALAAAGGAGMLQYAGQHVTVVSALAVAGALLLLVPSVPRLLPPGTLRFARGIPAIVAMRGVLAGSFFGAEAFVPLMLVKERGLTAHAAGLALTGAALSWAAASAYQGRAGLRISRARLVPLGCLIGAIGIPATLLALIPGLPAWVAMPTWALAGVGMGIAFPSLSVLLFEQSPASEQGANSAAIQVADALASIICIGSAGAIFAALHGTGGDAAFVVIFGAMAVIALAGALLGRRVSAPRPS